MKPICVPCERFMRCKRSGYYFLEGKPHGGSVEWDGRYGKNSQGWTPYKLWAGDLFECDGCGASAIAGVGQTRIAEHYEPDFAETVRRLGAVLLVKDC